MSSIATSTATGIVGQCDPDVPLGFGFLGQALDCFGGILQQISEGLAEQALVSAKGHGFGVDSKSNSTSGDTTLWENAALWSSVRMLNGATLGLGIPCEEKLFNHPSDVADLAEDRLDAAVEHAVTVVNLVGVTAPDSFRGKDMIGVSGFRISWAILRATSRQAAGAVR